MKKWTLLLLTVLVVFTLSACGKTKYSTEDYYGYYAGHYDTLNYLLSSNSSNGDLYANFVDGLVENDNYGNVIPSLATAWRSEMRDGKQVWTFDIRQGVKWVTKDGTEYATVKAQDWVTAANYILEPANESEVLFLMFLFVDGAEDYYNAKDARAKAQAILANPDKSAEDKAKAQKTLDETNEPDFNTVGVKAINDYTLEYTLAKPAPYFLTALTYSVFFPVNKEYLMEKGPQFGYNGENILYNGAYILTGDVVDSKVEFTQNESYWDIKNVHVKRVHLIYIPGNAGVDWYRLRYENGELTGFRLNERDVAGWTKYVVGKKNNGTKENPINPDAYNTQTTNQFTYFSIWNFNRTNYDGSTKTSHEQGVTKVALFNKDFRLGFFHGLDRKEYLQSATPENPTQYIRNTYNPRELAVDLNGKDYLDYFAEVYASKNSITSDEAKNLLADGKDAMYNKDKALNHFKTAKETLIAEGLVKESDFPIIVDMIGSPNPDSLIYYRAYINKFNEEFGDYVTIKLNVPTSDAQWREWSNSKLSYDLRFVFGWGPDYADPLTYLNTYTIQGDILDYSGLSSSAEDLVLQEKLFGEYTKLVNEADKFATLEDYPSRFAKFAEAEYKLLYEEALIIPFYSPNGTNVFISRTKPYTAMKANYGLSSSKFKYMVLLDTPLSRDEREALRVEYEANKK